MSAPPTRLSRAQWLLYPPGNAGALPEAVRRLSAAVNREHLQLRSDGTVEMRDYYRGGSTFPTNELRKRAGLLLGQGRAVILLEPTDRLSNRLSVVLRLDREPSTQCGSFVLEALGPGYDVSDLTRGGILPQLRVRVDDVDWTRYRELWWSDLHTIVRMSLEDEQVRRRRRLQRLAGQLLPDAGKLPLGASPTDAEKWLRTHAYLGLWRSWNPISVIRNVHRWFDDAFILGNSQLAGSWRCLAMAASNLGQGRTVYWDVVDGQRKYTTTHVRELNLPKGST